MGASSISPAAYDVTRRSQSSGSSAFPSRFRPIARLNSRHNLGGSTIEALCTPVLAAHGPVGHS